MPGWGARRLSGAQRDRLRVVALATCAVAAFVLAPSGWRWAWMCGFLVAGATLAMVFRRPDLPGRLMVLLIGGFLTAAAVTVWQPQSRAYGVAAAAVAVILYPAARLADPHNENDTRRRQLKGFVQGAAIGATIVLAGLVALGLFERSRASFAMRYGEQVSVTVADLCAGLTGGSCPDSTWTIDGHTYTGTLQLGSNEFASSPKQAWTVLGDTRAFTARHYSASPNGLEPVGLVPLWLSVPVLLIMTVGALPVRLWRRARRSDRAATPASKGNSR